MRTVRTSAHIGVERPSLQQPADFAKQRPDGFRGKLNDLVESRSFEALAFLNLFVNILLVGLQTDYHVQNLTFTVPITFLAAEGLCCTLFIIEVILRTLANINNFLWGPERLLNRLDVCLAVSQVAEVAMTISVTGHVHERAFNFAIARGLRIARVIRLLRSVRLLQYFAEVRSIALAIVLCIRPLVGVLIFLMFLMYIYSVIFIEIALEDMIEARAHHVELKFWFGSIMTTCHTLMMSVTGGVTWGDVSRFLPHLARTVVFPFFIVWTTLGMFNVITGAFVESTSVRIREDMAQLLHGCFEKQLKLHSIDGTSRISKSLFKQTLASDPRLKRSLALTSTDIEKLFVLFDPAGHDSVDVDDILGKIQIVVGPARRLEQEVLLWNICDREQASEFVGTWARGPPEMAAQI